jgi:hypothetical protein
MWGININYLENCSRRQKLDSMLVTYNVIGTLHFPTKIINGSVSPINNISIDKTRNYTVRPFINSMSNHDTQVITMNNIFFTEMSSLHNSVLKKY